MKRKPDGEGEGEPMSKRHYGMPPEMHYNTMAPPVQNLPAGGWHPNVMNNVRGGGVGGYGCGYMWKNPARGGVPARGNPRGFYRGNKVAGQGRYDSGGGGYPRTCYNYPYQQQNTGYNHQQPWPADSFGDCLTTDIASLASVPPPPPGTPLTAVQQQLSQNQPPPQAPPPPPPPPQQQQQQSQSQNHQPQPQAHQQQNQQQQNQSQNQQQQQPQGSGTETVTIDETGAEEFTKSKSSKRRPMSQSYPSRPWNKEAAEKALSMENEYLKGLRNQSLIIRFPDPELSKEVVKKFHPGIENVHFQVPSGPRFCFVQLADDISPDDVIKDLQNIEFGAGTLKVEKKITKEEDNLSAESIDPYTLYIGNLPSNINIQTVKDTFPTAARIDIGFAQRMKFTRYAFVRYNSAEAAIEAFKATHNLVLDSRSMIVRFRRQRGPRSASSPTNCPMHVSSNPQSTQPEGSPAPPPNIVGGLPCRATTPTASTSATTVKNPPSSPVFSSRMTSSPIPHLRTISPEPAKTPPIPSSIPLTKVQLPAPVALKTPKVEAEVLPQKVKTKKEKSKIEVVKIPVFAPSDDEEDDEDDEDDDDDEDEDEEEEDDDEEEEDEDDDDDDDEDDDEEEEDDDDDEEEEEEDGDDDDDDEMEEEDGDDDDDDDDDNDVIM